MNYQEWAEGYFMKCKRKETFYIYSAKGLKGLYVMMSFKDIFSFDSLLETNYYKFRLLFITKYCN